MLLSLFLVALGGLQTTCDASRRTERQAREPPEKALYVMSNEVSGNNVVAVSIAANGSLFGGKSVSTGGIGGNYVSPTDGHPLVPDALSSQDSLIAVGKFLFATNAGSNTVSMFTKEMTGLELLGAPKPSLGQFPTTLAASLEAKLICVANTGAQSGISCASFSEDGLSDFDMLRPLDVGETQTPPVGPVPGISDVYFAGDMSYLFVNVKGNPGIFTTYAAVFKVENGSVATTATIATPPGSAVLFGTSLIDGTSNALVADAGFGALILDLADLSAEPVALVNITGQQASCWAATSGLTKTGFVTDAAVNRLVEIDLSNGDIVQEYYPPTPFPGMTDMAIGGEFLWTLSAGNGTTPPSINTFDLGAGRGQAKFVTAFAIPGVTANVQGLVAA
ncbi:hypothetical protein EDD36DRAFT_446205 [Exophiala viscosa]|uniref:3-carboxymuconate cyclase n=1 Tax=Exophiala viscosa TaxID=2486360 RepID=A0AAN6DPZ7_9EURO|nr:hypothetical protein EDD36DRAFT_446205 [Exophiala viscosa]